MENFNFYSPTEFVFGKDTEMDCGKYVKKHGGSKVLIHYGSSSAVKSGLLDRVKKSLEESNIAYVCLGGVKPNPRDTNDDPSYDGEPSDSTGEFATQEEVAALFDEIYDTAKDFLIKEELDFDTAEQKVFAQEMMERGEKELEELIKKIN